MSALAIIGTAGRGPDGDRLKADPGYWRTMKAVAEIVVVLTEPTRLVSGSAAYADHLAVQLYLDGLVPELVLHMPVEWMGHGFRETGGRFDAGRTSNYYHSLFSAAMGLDSLGEIQQAIERGAVVHSGSGGFKERNTEIAREADVMLAFTFGDGTQLRDGGTADTWAKYLSRRGQLYALEGGDPEVFAAEAYHYCLNQRRLYRHRGIPC